MLRPHQDASNIRGNGDVLLLPVSLISGCGLFVIMSGVEDDDNN